MAEEINSIVDRYIPGWRNGTALARKARGPGSIPGPGQNFSLPDFKTFLYLACCQNGTLSTNAHAITYYFVPNDDVFCF